MIKKKVKRIIGAALTLALASNSITYTAAVNTPGEKNNTATNVQAIEGDYLRKPTNSSEEDFKISKEIDTASEEVISVIVEFVSEPTVLSAKEAKAFSLSKVKVDRDHKIFEKFLAKMPKTYSTEAVEVKNSYTNVFNGVSLNIKASEVENLFESGVVKRVHKDAEVVVEQPVEVQKRATEVETNQIEPYMMDSVPYLGVDTLHDEDIKGQGIKVGVLDTGIDYNHPDLTNAYQGFRNSDGDPNSQDIDSVIGWDFVDGDADPMETTYKDWQGSGKPEFDSQGGAYYTAHGTHVSGTIAGQKENPNTDMPVLGVAPEVELYGYRVLGPYGSGATSGIIGAIEKSVIDGMDVINMSLGNGANNSPYDPMTIAVNNATLAGVVTVISNGNSGPNNFTVGNPGTSPLPIAVGASTVDFNYDTYDVKLGDLTISGEIMAKDLQSSINKYEGQELEVVYCGLGKPEDFEGKDLTGKIAYVERGEIALVDKAANAKKYGAAFAIMSNNVDSGRMSYLGELDVANTIAISKADGAKLKENLDKKIAITSTGSILVEGDEITSFSSVGPVKQTYDIRPDVVAPGAQVFSTVPEFINDKNEDVDNYGIAYQRMSGTSMSAPHVSGIAALILQANPEYTPEQVKAALMNTSEHIHQKSGESYSVHEAGAGRVNPVNAVKEKVSFNAKYKVFAGEEGMTYDNVTGMISYGKLNMPEEGVGTKTIPVTVENNTDEAKTYNVEVEYSDSKRAKDAAKNGVNLTLPETVTVASGETTTFDVTITAPVGAEFGTYEGYVHFNEVGNDKNDYQMPFSATVKKNGFDVVDYPDMQGYAKGIAAFTSANMLNRNENLYMAFSDINVLLSVNDPIKNIYFFVKDAETGEYIGHAGTEEGWWIPEGVTVIVEGIVPNGKVNKIVDGKISHEQITLKDGAYELEIIAEKTNGETFTDSMPMGIINDTSTDTQDFNFEPGIIEVTEDMFTKELWYDGAMHEGIWLKANVNNTIVDKLKNEKGLSYLKQNEVASMFTLGFYPNGNSVGMGTMSEGEETIKVAGVERSDLDNGFFRMEVSFANAGKVTDELKDFIFVKEDTQYVSMELPENISKDKPVKSTITLNNVKDVAKGNFKLKVYGDADLAVSSITPTKELQDILNENGNEVKVNIEKTKLDHFNDEFQVSFEITGDNVKGLTGDLNLFDIEYTVEDLKGYPETLMDGYQFRYNRFEGQDGEFRNSANEIVDVKAGTINKNAVIDSDRTVIYGNTRSIVRGVKGSKVYAVDPQGNKYEPTYLEQDMFEYGYTFAFNDLPIINGDYNLIVETPGAFNSIVNVPGSKLNKAGERVGNAFSLAGQSFQAPYGIGTVLGDTNGDGAIDIVDTMEVAKSYEFELQTRAKEDSIVDFNGDGKVNRLDMDVILASYLKQDLTRTDSKTPESVVDGKDIIDVLESCGYFDETPEYNVQLEMDKEASVVGETVNLVAIPPIEGVEFEYELSVKEKGISTWTVLSEKSDNNKFTWTSEKAGNYEFKLRIFKDDIEYVVQDNKTHVVKDIVVSKPAKLSGESTNSSVALTWEAPKTTDGLVGYVIYKDGKEVATVDNGTTEYTVEELRANTIYGFKVVAKYSNGEVSKPVSKNVRTTK
ncbi:S8 family serine peptidase [Clostridium sp.]|uniref:S8 family serine peptidase n=1 Tax=Clostridium sp. TaxID=1506 RepID=UPI003F380198